mgnify:CR=1 FL=1
MQRIEAIDEYNRAQRLGMRDYREKTAAGKYPYLPALDELLEKTDTESQIPLGTIEIPLDYVVGTKTTGRTMAFASNFMPLLPEDTEFASKWLSLCMAHMEEGIHDAIKAYEYMGRFYVQEGNKRVSVLKYFGADSIFATVTRVVPRFNDTPEIREYYEFMEYYPLCGLYRLHFTQEGRFARLQKALGKAPDEKWTADDKAEVVSLMNWITKAYNAHGGDKMRTTPADVMLLLLRLYKLDELKTYSPAQFAAAIDAVWDNVLALERPEPVKLSTQPSAPAKKNSLLNRILPGIRSEPSHLKVAFVNERTPETSTWTSQHEFGRTQLDQVFAGKVETVAYHGAEPGKNADELVEKAIQDGADMVFTTSPKLVGASLRAALRHPDVRILNCSVDMPYASIRTYYSRVYEAKFITGAIAAAVAREDRVGYVAANPVYGIPAAVNAYAQGLKTVRPEAKVVLRWACLPDPAHPLDFSDRPDVEIFYARDNREPEGTHRDYGLVRRMPDGSLQPLGLPVWRWDTFYIEIVRSIFDGAWDSDAAGARAVNYWWGMRSGAEEIDYSKDLPAGTLQLLDLMEKMLHEDDLRIFPEDLYAQGHVLHSPEAVVYSPKELMEMDWLDECVEGALPHYDELDVKTHVLMAINGLNTLKGFVK